MSKKISSLPNAIGTTKKTPAINAMKHINFACATIPTNEGCSCFLPLPLVLHTQHARKSTGPRTTREVKSSIAN